MTAAPALPYRAPLRIGPVHLETPVILAPLAGITTPAFRTLCEEQGAGLTFTEMVSAPGLVRGNPKVAALIARSSPGAPLAVQLVGASRVEIAEAASLAVSRGAALIDINMGCPVSKVAKTGGGVALMATPEIAEALVRAAREAAPEHVGITVKMRLGWDDETRNAPGLAVRLVKAGAGAITVHGRTGRQGFRGGCDLQGIRRVVQAVGGDVPVIGNGDVHGPGDMARMLAETGCDGVMIGRAALGNPWVFARLRAGLTGEPGPHRPTPAERVALMRRHITLALACSPEREAVAEMRKHLSWTSRGIPGSAAFRNALQSCRRAEQVKACLRALEETARIR